METALKSIAELCESTLQWIQHCKIRNLKVPRCECSQLFLSKSVSEATDVEKGKLTGEASERGVKSNRRSWKSES